jgi:integrase
MASVKFLIRGTRNPSKIIIRLIVDKKTDLRRTIPVFIDPSYFNNKSGKVRQIAEFKDKKNVQSKLDDLKHFILQKFNDANQTGEFINSDWLQECISSKFNPVEKTDNNYLENYCELYSKKLKLKTNEKTGEMGASKATITKYKTIHGKIMGFQKHSKKKYRLTDVNLSFRDEFLTYLLEVDKLGRNTAGRYIKFLKTICLDAQRSGFIVSTELLNIKGFKVEVEKIFLNFDELDKIENTSFVDEQLNNAKDWLIIGCYIGQRAGDLLQLTSGNIHNHRNFKIIELKQQKTKKKVSIPIPPKVQLILDKRNGEFPTTYSNNIGSSMTIFNRLIKRVCYKAKINQVINGGKIDPDTNRKKQGDYPKFQLVTSHICRRSFATNHYGDIPTPLLINITGHSTEKEFLNYIGKTSIDYAEQMLDYWNKQIQKQEQKQKTVLKAVK